VSWLRLRRRAFSLMAACLRVAPPNLLAASQILEFWVACTGRISRTWDEHNLFDGAHSMGPAQSRPHGQTSLPVPPEIEPFQAKPVLAQPCSTRRARVFHLMGEACLRKRKHGTGPTRPRYEIPGRSRHYSVQPLRYSRRRNASASGQPTALRFAASHVSFLPVRRATLQSSAASVNAPE
jgi:hypothetical protein